MGADQTILNIKINNNYSYLTVINYNIIMILFKCMILCYLKLKYTYLGIIILYNYILLNIDYNIITQSELLQ